jgi:catechol 2,3-dioxygenase-like lactoylglutathione lyase family enzyme
MKLRISMITLAVDDLERAVRFYRDGLGLPTEGIIGEQFEHGAVAFFDLQAGLKLALWPRSKPAHSSSSRRRILSGAATPAISRTPPGISGKSYGTRSCCRRTRRKRTMMLQAPWRERRLSALPAATSLT